MNGRRLVAAIACVLGAGCGEDAEVAGSYTIAVTNRDNGCEFANWTVGNTAAGIPVSITQDGASVTATVEGVVGSLLTLSLGANVYTGDVDGDELALTLYGTRSQTEGNCTFTNNSTLRATVDGDALVGRIDYTRATNGNPDCARLASCVTYQDFNGTRPPR